MGLAWTQYGGDILPIEVTLYPGKGDLVLTGQLKDVMKESFEDQSYQTQEFLDFVKYSAGSP